jgi:hypothetical protein
VFPVLSKQGKAMKDLVPTRWVAIDSTRGDLNQDKLDDLALIFEFHAAVKEKRAYGDNTTDLITELQKPRILAVYFKNKNSTGYTLSLQNNDFILRSDEGGMLGDPLQPMTISENKIQLNFQGGGNWKWVLNYAFLYQNKEWYLAEANNLSTHKVTGEMSSKSYNFITKKVQVTESNAFSRSATNRFTERDLKMDRLRTFSTFKKPWTWHIATDEFL